MTDIITELADAVTVIKRKCQTDLIPVLTDTAGGEIEQILDEFKIADIWAEATTYKLGDIVVPTDDNRVGRRFRCVRAGLSAATPEEEPEWGNSASWASATQMGVYLGNVGSGSVVLSDNEASWVDDGVETDLWNLDEAESEAWETKASKALNLITINRGGNNYDLQKIYDRCREKAKTVGGVFIA